MSEVRANIRREEALIGVDKQPHHKAAVEYQNAPLCDKSAIYSWSALARDVGRLYRYVLSKGVVMEAQKDWRYLSFDMLRRDIEQGRIIRALDFFPHPVWDSETQAMFRVVHDYFHYETGADFTIEGEFDIVTKHHRHQFSAAAYPAIVAEIYNQAAFNLVYGYFGPNKVFIPELAVVEHNKQQALHQTVWDWSRPDCNAVLSER